MNDSHHIKPIATIETPFGQKFGVPRQSGIVATEAVILFISPYDSPKAFKGLEKVSHIWLTFVFHKHIGAEEKLSVRPPRFGGNEQYGVFATRSSFRPNALGQSLVKLKEIVEHEDKISLLVEGADLIDGTPIVDIKPYLPYSDCCQQAVNELAPQSPQKNKVQVELSGIAEKQIMAISDLRDDLPLIKEILSLDPRPAYQKDQPERQYGFLYKGYDIHWRCVSGKALITEIVKKEEIR